MKKDDLLDIIGMADDDLVERAADAMNTKKARTPWKKWVPAAACAVIVLCAVPAVMIAGNRKTAMEASGMDNVPRETYIVSSTATDGGTMPMPADKKQNTGSMSDDGTVTEGEAAVPEISEPSGEQTAGTDSETGTKSEWQAEKSSESDPMTEPESAPGEPPRMLAFASLDEVGKLISAAELTDGELDAFLSQHNYDMNGISTRSELEAFTERLMAMKIAVPEGYSDVLGFTYYPDRDVLDMFFLVGGEKVRVVNDLAYGGSTVICDAPGDRIPMRDTVFGEIMK